MYATGPLKLNLSNLNSQGTQTVETLLAAPPTASGRHRASVGS